MSSVPDELVERLEDVHQYNGYISCRCMFHDDHKPSMFVYPDKFWCAACGKHGSTSWLLRKLDTLHFVKYPKQEVDYHNPFSKWLRDNELEDIIYIAHKNIPVQYLQDRKINRQVQQELKLGYIDNWITFPLLDEYHHVIGAVARKGEGSKAQSKYILPSGQSPNLLYVPSWERIQQQDKVFVTFGIIDAVTIYACGLAAISTTTGKRVNPQAFDKIRKQLVIVPDLGEEQAGLQLASRLGWRGSTLQFRFPDKAKDINDLMWKSNYSLQEMRECLCNGKMPQKLLQDWC